jgi:hypothetical protein
MVCEATCSNRMAFHLRKVGSQTFIGRAGDPTQIVLLGNEPVTTEFAPMTVPAPIFAPARIDVFSPIHTRSPIDMGFTVSWRSTGGTSGLSGSGPLYEP